VEGIDSWQSVQHQISFVVNAYYFTPIQATRRHCVANIRLLVPRSVFSVPHCDIWSVSHVIWRRLIKCIDYDHPAWEWMRMKNSKVFSIKWSLLFLCALRNLSGGTEEYYKTFDQKKTPSVLESNPWSSEGKKHKIVIVPLVTTAYHVIKLWM
jgi:hypothetical protein